MAKIPTINMTPDDAPVIVNKELRYYFTDGDRLKMGDEMAKASEELEALEEEKADFAAKMKAKMGEAQGILKGTGRKIRMGFEMRMIECRMEKDFLTNTVRITRQDTGELVEERALTIEERQRFLDLPPGSGPGGPEGQEAQRH